MGCAKSGAAHSLLCDLRGERWATLDNRKIIQVCCFFAVLLFFGPRLAFLIFWLVPAGQTKVNVAFNGWVTPLLGLIFIPWTTLIYVIIFPVHGFDWFWIVLAVAADAAAYSSGYRTRKDLPGYTGP